MILASASSQLTGMQIFSVAARSLVFRDNHMRSAPDATRDPVEVASNCLLVRNAGVERDLTILCDSGPGLHLPENVRQKFKIDDHDILTENLAQLGVSAEDIDVYLPSHLHWDHTGWAFEGGRFVLPNARVVISEQALQDNARVDSDNDLSFLPAVPEILADLQEQGRLTLLDATAYPIDGEGAALEWLSDGIRFYFSRGHSEGQMHAVFSAAQGTIVFGGDFWPTEWHAHDPSRYMPQFDKRDREALLANKRAFLPHVVDGAWYLYFYHDPQIRAAQVITTDNGYTTANPLTDVAWT